MVDELDLVVATQTRAPVLITAPTAEATMQVAADVHAASGFGTHRLTTTSAAHFPTDALAFHTYWSQLLGSAMGGSLLITSVDALPRRIQEAFTDALNRIATQHVPVRVMAGTTKALFKQVETGRFSEALFYRLNVVHLLVDPASAE
jgi:DNA-binding NtrC family response regulator